MQAVFQKLYKASDKKIETHFFISNPKLCVDPGFI